MYAKIALLSPPYASLTYGLAPEFPASFWQRGLRVAVPLGRGEKSAPRAGIVVRLEEVADLPEGIALRNLIWPLEAQPLIGSDLLDLFDDLAIRQGVSLGQVLGHILPQGLRSSRVRLRLFAPRPRFVGIGQIRVAQQQDRLDWAKSVCCGEAMLLPHALQAAEQEFCHLAVDPPWPVRPSAKRQIEVLEYLHANGATSRRSLATALGSGVMPVLTGLVQAGHVRMAQEDIEEDERDPLLPPPPLPFELNAGQKAAVDEFSSICAGQKAAMRLLYGVTGSGKTAVYLELARACLARGQSVMLLAPEVAIAHKLYRDAFLALPDATMILYHGYQSPARREHAFRRLSTLQDPVLVVGTRSALFLPVAHLSCIILDEEHDASFKQDEGLPYQAKEVAWARMHSQGGLLLLGSATPDLKTFHAVQSGLFPMLSLPKRVADRPLPSVEIVDIGGGGRSDIASKLGGMLAEASEDALRETLDRGEQAVVLLNRRGYAPLMFCLDCKATLRCPQCEIGLTYHKGLERLVCHYCGYTQNFPSPCPRCRGVNYLPLGEGTERLAERLGVLAGKPVLRLDRDSTRRVGSIEEILAAFARGDSPVLVGTQMLSKGHHFPLVTLAIVVDADLGLNLPDYRAAERTFQLLVQSSGRAGRGERPGRVIIQSRDANHYCWQYVQKADYEGFYADELERRRKRRYPPFVKLALIRISHDMGDASAAGALAELARQVRGKAGELGVQVLGPASAPLALLRNRRRFHCLLKAENWQAIRNLYHFAHAGFGRGPLRLTLDLDPVNML